MKKLYPFRQGYSINKNMILKKHLYEYISNEINNVNSLAGVEDPKYDTACENAILKMTD